MFVDDSTAEFWSGVAQVKGVVVPLAAARHFVAHLQATTDSAL